ncbi:hypothetical protein [Flavobacterium sp. W21_SRS_FM6]|uniref:hypothetical protein n=1 Tax=Flavobacterium sp. W21_SRS_FM6 TaxID=3240268 RepID=UPI003F909759
MWYHLLGWLSSAVFIFTWYGLSHQILQMVKAKKHSGAISQSLSINQFSSSFFAFYANFIFGLAASNFNHYLVWTRLGALLLLLVILAYIWRDRRSATSLMACSGAAMAIFLGFVAMGFRPFPTLATYGTNTFVVIVALILVQGTVHQIMLIKKEQSVGSLSESMIVSIIVKDLSTLAFALTMPLAAAWPLLFMNGASILSRGFLWLTMRSMAKSA